MRRDDTGLSGAQSQRTSRWMQPASKIVRMDRPRSKGRLSSALILIGAAILGASALYGISYAMLGHEITIPSSGAQRNRVFDARWQANLYQPAAKIESVILGTSVQLWHSAELFSSTLTPVP